MPLNAVRKCHLTDDFIDCTSIWESPTRIMELNPSLNSAKRLVSANIDASSKMQTSIRFLKTL